MARLLGPAALAAAASVLLAIGVGVFVSTRGPAEPMLARAEVGLESEIESGMRPKGRQAFASGDTIMFRIVLGRAGYVVLINLDRRGQPEAVRLNPPAPELVRRLPPGRAILGPHTLDDIVGLETFFIVAAEREITDIPSRLEELRSAYAREMTTESVAALIRRWPAEVKVISFQHVAAE